MIMTKPIISGVKDRCSKCSACIRVCPVKAIKIIDGQVEIVDAGCIYCGRCLKVCAPEAIVMRQDDDLVKEWLVREEVVAIVASEIYAAFPGLTINSLRETLLDCGFYAVEESILGEELVAKEYLAYIQRPAELPIIRSTCASIVEMVEKYYPEFISNLAPIVSPMAAQARLIKSLYQTSTKVIYIGPCVAKKSEAQKLPDGVIDAVLTFKELKSLIGRDSFNAYLNSQPDGGPYKYPMVAHNYAASDGFPREILQKNSLIDKSLIVSWGADRTYKFMDRVSALKTTAKLFDLMACQGCIDGPVMETEIMLEERKRLTANYYHRIPKRSIAFESLKPSLPAVDLNASFSSQKVE
ncbi:MAG TPA: 4Fe-4S dicluster domain-containing protein, partial [Actinobacteria bacterium]|nr:4Fe-4S dicluster domain-containing protein [Actinomycetes bacterium]HEX21504.1 4Fe-4S dicluster domain-containing protein [Actinomycetota bacterium]